MMISDETSQKMLQSNETLPNYLQNVQCFSDQNLLNPNHLGHVPGPMYRSNQNFLVFSKNKKQNEQPSVGNDKTTKESTMITSFRNENLLP